MLYQNRWRQPNQQNSYNLQRDFLKDVDWEDLMRWQKILTPFRQLCEQEEGRAQKAGREGQYGTLQSVITGMNYMYDVLKKAQIEVNEHQDDLEQTEHYNSGINAAWLKLEKYFRLTDQSPLYIAAVVLHPGRRFAYFEDKWREHPGWIKAAKKSFKDLFLEYCNRISLTDSTDDSESEADEPKSAYHAYNEVSQEYLNRQGQKQHRENVELNTYTKTFNRRLRKLKNPLAWWKEQTEFPILSRMAFDVFSIPGMSSEVERIFSAAKRLITDDRNCLGPEIVEACECQRHWLKANLVE